MKQTSQSRGLQRIPTLLLAPQPRVSLNKNNNTTRGRREKMVWWLAISLVIYVNIHVIRIVLSVLKCIYINTLRADQILSLSATRDYNWMHKNIQTHGNDREDVTVVDVSSQFATLSLMGPNSRELLSQVTNMNLSNEVWDPFFSPHFLTLSQLFF